MTDIIPTVTLVSNWFKVSNGVIKFKNRLIDEYEILARNIHVNQNKQISFSITLTENNTDVIIVKLINYIQESLTGDSVCELYLCEESSSFGLSKKMPISKYGISALSVSTPFVIKHEMELTKWLDYNLKIEKVVIVGYNVNISKRNELYSYMETIADDVTQHIGGTFSFIKFNYFTEEELYNIKNLLLPNEQIEISVFQNNKKNKVYINKQK